MISENLVQKYNVKKYNCILEINFDHLLKMILQTTKSYKGIPLYPSSTRDLAFVFENDVTWQSIKKVVMGASEGGEILLENVELFDIYKGKNLGEGKKSVAFKLSFRSDVRTLQDEEIQSFTQKIISEVEGKLGGVLR